MKHFPTPYDRGHGNLLRSLGCKESVLNRIEDDPQFFDRIKRFGAVLASGRVS